ncbi:rubrerythrin [Candidatus Vecturithrix granuli]|uniref:Rubrerythrin n=1 Tax=Vecturithrix granuli TaxID=1499967 RepID=A0A0S6WAH2_VECG1|nr:rubrerythrin [Candidatus Vecturithrix granuli]
MAANEQLIKIFEYALNQEKTGLSFFETSLHRLGIGAAVTAFKKLIEEEKKHVIFITNIINDLKQGGDISVKSIESVTITPTNFFDERAKSEFMAQSVEQAMTPDISVFHTAMLIERDLSAFYARMAEQLEEKKAKEAFKMLSNWEKGHERFFAQIHEDLVKEYEGMPWGG